VFEYDPGRHGLQDKADKEKNVPSVEQLQDLDSDITLAPDGQAVQLVEPVAEENCPFAHGVQALAPAAANDPAKHGVHDTAPTAANDPLAHGLHGAHWLFAL